VITLHWSKDASPDSLPTKMWMPCPLRLASSSCSSSVFLLEQAEQAAQPVHVAGKILHMEQIVFAADDVIFGLFRLGRIARRECRRHQRVHVLMQLLQLAAQPVAYLREAATDVMLLRSCPPR